MLQRNGIRTSFRLAILSFALLFLFGYATVHAAEMSRPSTVLPYTPYDVIRATNKAREARGLDPLKMNIALVIAAQKKANDMVNAGYFGHTAPVGTKYWNYMTDAGYPFKSAGENLAFRYKNTSLLLKEWLKSSGHRANVLGAQFTDIGVGMAYGEHNGLKGWYVVELFGSEHYNTILTLK